MALDFPANPTIGQTFTSGGVTWVFDGVKWNAQTQVGAPVIIGDAPPANPNAGALWWDSVGGQMYIWYSDPNTSQWVPTTNNAGGVPEAPTDGQVYARRGSDASWQQAATPAQANINVGRNFLHNPLFNVLQRPGPFTPAAGVVGYTADRWFVYPAAAGDSINAQAVAQNDGNRAQIGDEDATWLMSCGFTGGSGASNLCNFATRIEGVRKLAGKTVTVSWWSSASTTLRLGVSLLQRFGTGGSPSADVYVPGQIVTPGVVWTRYSATFAVPSTVGKTLGTNNDDWTQLTFTMSNGGSAFFPAVGAQSGTFNFWGMQLEIGGVATALEKPHQQQDIAKCQRFYTVLRSLLISGYTPSAGAGVANGYTLPTFMRAAPSLALNPISFSNATGTSANGSTNTTIAVSFVTPAAGNGYVYFDAFATADL